LTDPFVKVRKKLKKKQLPPNEKKTVSHRGPDLGGEKAKPDWEKRVRR